MRRDEAGGQPGPNLTYQRCKAAGQRGENLLLEATHSKNWTKTYSNDAENVIMEADTGIVRLQILHIHRCGRVSEDSRNVFGAHLRLRL